MRLSVCIGLFFAMSLNLIAATRASGQNISETMVNFEVHNADLKSSLEKLQEQSGFSIFYSSTLLNKDKKVNILSGNRSVAAVLDLILSGTNLVYLHKGNKIILQEKKSVAPAADTTSPAVAIVSGIVRDESGQPIPGVTVRIKNGTKHTAADQFGHYSLQPDAESSVLIFSIIGYLTQEVPVRGKSTIAVTMARSFSNLGEVQVIGYGNTTKRANTGAVSSIKADEIAVQNVTNPLTALQGHIAGMQITQDNGLPGAGVRVRIRGNASIMSGALPLYVVDGIPFTLYSGGFPPSDGLNAYGTTGANGSVSPFSMINPDDIERIDVLKDADATAIYGSKGANGVVLITTKKGARGNTKVSANLYHGYGEVNYFMPMMNTQQYLAMRNEAFVNAGTTPTSTDYDLTKWDQNAYTDWQKWALGGKAQTTGATASISGGTAQNTFLFSTTYRKEGTVFPGDYNNTTFSNRLNAGHSSADNRFNMSISANYSYMNNNLPTTDLTTAFSTPPNFNPLNENGTLNWDYSSNPMAFLLQKYSGQTTNLLTDMTLRYNILKELAIKANLGYSLTTLHQQNASPGRSTNNTATTANQLTDADNKNSNWIVEPYAEYSKTIAKDGHLQVVIGTTFQQTKSTGVTLFGTNFSTEALMTAIGAAGNVVVQSNNYSLYKYAAGFGRFNFNWKEKYYLDGTFRRDGSSRFGSNNQFGSFGAIGAAWIFSQEDFMKNIRPISFGKFRASYGVTGNDQIQNYMYTPLYTTGFSSYAYMGNAILIPDGVANPDLKWETTKKLDVALELGFLKDRLMLKTDFYQNRTSNMLGFVTVPGQSGTTSYTGNLPAVIENKGWEFELTSTNISNKDITWSTSLNLTFNKNKLVSFDDIANSSYATSYTVGKSIDAPMIYQYTGVDPQTGTPQITDLNNDGAVNFLDRYSAPVGTPYYGGLSNTISYKGFTLDFTFQFNHRMSYLNNALNMYFNPYGYDMTNMSTAILNRWQQAGQTAEYGAATRAYSNNYFYYASSNGNWGDASFVKFKTLSLTYNLPKNWLSKARIANAAIYARGQNLFTWAKQKYTLDPETTLPGTGANLGTGQFIAFPQLRTMTVGINLSL